MSLLEITELTHGYGEKTLYRNTTFCLNKGEHMGIVGQNGTGKSTLIGILSGEIVPDAGQIKRNAHIKIGYLDQYAVIKNTDTIQEYLQTAFKEMYNLEERVLALYDQYAQTNEESLLQEASELQTKLETQGFYTVDTQIEKVVNGLGLSAIGTERMLSQLSGGQRAKVILAKLLLEKPEVLLLDEPTNFLDKEHIDWLGEYLVAFPNAFIVVSHDYQFLERISTCISDVEGGSIRKYHGKYSDFLKQKQHLREDYIRQYNSQQAQIKKTEEFIRKNIAGVNSKIAKGRRKQLERMERLEAPTFITVKPHFYFPGNGLGVQEALKVENLEVGYYYSLLPKISFVVRGGQKIVITGFNGIGKSTLLKTLMGQVPKRAGMYYFAEQAQIGYYEQDLRWENPKQTPMQIISDRSPKRSEKEIRRLLTQHGVQNEHIMQEIATLSGGEQAKVKLCILSLFQSNFLILDEPTNHLDVESKDELKDTLIHYKGSILLVSHDESFYHGWADKVMNIGEMC